MRYDIPTETKIDKLLWTLFLWAASYTRLKMVKYQLAFIIVYFFNSCICCISFYEILHKAVMKIAIIVRAFQFVLSATYCKTSKNSSKQNAVDA